MADKKSKDNPYQWPNGQWHSIPWQQEQARLQAAAVLGGWTPGSTVADAMQRGAPYNPAPAAPVAAAPAQAAQPAASGPQAPAAPTPVSPFLNGDDLLAISSFYTDLNTKLAGIDAQVGKVDPATNKYKGGDLEANTNYSESQNNDAAQKNTSAAQDDAIARGIFSSSIKDATLFDIEAQRSLANKFLDDQLTTARLNAGTQKQILSTAKGEFDKRYGTTDANGNPIWGTKAFENAGSVNDANNSAWAAAMAAFNTANPAALAPGGTPPATPALAPPKPAAPKPSNTLFAPTPAAKQTNSSSNPNRSTTGSGSTSKKPRVVTSTARVYGP